ncbi:hypothetical protein CHL78_012865 [Romboutsia weinsteinii]|uniref:DUF3147 family protein n=1 Tax=Romboutsia weinsteinii TaxID=2020949 RepID=A0A371J176_9FIRM|nr:hypothetical protein [Romboutsia weinsteinii]RDY26539.1 hypothetical protein CHL78_012865 [Romboutsia weinsteinii]
MEKKDIGIIIFPSILMILATIISFGEISFISHLDVKGFFVLSLVLIFPTLIFMQGILSGKNRINIFLSLGISLVTFIVIMVIYLNTSASIYIGVYIISWSLGYFLSKLLFRKIDVQENEEELQNQEK